MKLAFLCPGQGSQFVGMGKELCEQFPVAGETFDLVSEVSGLPLRELCFQGPLESLTETKVTQPAIFCHSVAIARVLLGNGIRPDFTAGHSLGEYAAHICAGTFSLPVATELVTIRGREMQRAAESRKGGMLALMPTTEDIARQLCQAVEADSGEILSVAALNSPGQVVVSGTVKGVELAAARAREAFQIRRAMPLTVSGAWHSRLMSPAEKIYNEALAGTVYQSASCPVVANRTGKPVTSEEEIRTTLLEQLCHPVRWTDCLQFLVDAGVDTFVEVGPGKVLSGLLKRFNRDVRCFATSDVESMNMFIEEVKSCE